MRFCFALPRLKQARQKRLRTHPEISDRDGPVFQDRPVRVDSHRGPLGWAWGRRRSPGAVGGRRGPPGAAGGPPGATGSGNGRVLAKGRRGSPGAPWPKKRKAPTKIPRAFSRYVLRSPAKVPKLCGCPRVFVGNIFVFDLERGCSKRPKNIVASTTRKISRHHPGILVGTTSPRDIFVGTTPNTAF